MSSKYIKPSTSTSTPDNHIFNLNISKSWYFVLQQSSLTAKQHKHQSNPTQSGAEDMLQKLMSKQHVPCANDCVP